MQQRYYDPGIGRFLSIDLVQTDANTGASFNRYSYAANNPYRFTDPDGRQERAAEKWGEAAATMTSAEKEPFASYRNPENPKNDTVRTVPGRPESSQPGQQADHIVRTANGARYGEANTPMPVRSSESHVPPEKIKFVPADKLPKP